MNYWNTHIIDTTNTVNEKHVYYWKNQTSGTVIEGAGEVILANCTNVIVENQNVSDGSVGILMGFSSGNTIANNTASENSQYGIYIQQSSGNTIINNNASNNDKGIYLDHSDRNNITNNTASSNSNDGIYLYSSNRNNITNNTASNNRYGMHFYSSDSNTLSNNIVSNSNYYGVYLYGSQNDVLTENTMINDSIFIDGGSPTSWNTHNIDMTNTVSGKPVYYLKNQTGGTVPTGAGEVILANCSGIIVENQNVSDGTVGILMGFSSGNTIANNTASANSRYGIYIYQSSGNTIINNNASNNYYGIYLSKSNSNTITNNTPSNNNYGISLSNSESNNITNNTAYSNNYDGIYLYYSNSNNITSNTASSNNYYGIYLSNSDSNNITNNTASNSWYSIYLYSSNSNTIYHNNFITNANQAYDSTGSNLWNLSYPEGGNYWSDYDGADSFSGPNQDILGSDGIGDTYYTNIYGGSGALDNYPLMHPTSYTPHFLENTPWPMFRHDIFHTGVSAYNSSAGAWLYWNFTTGGEVSGSAAIADDGTIYTGSSDGKLYAINPDGTEKWNFAADGSINGSSPAIANDGTIYFGTMNGTLYALHPDGTEKWNHSIGSPILSSPTIGSDGTIYIGANNSRLYAIEQNGTEKWNYPFSSNITTSPVIDQDGKIIFSSYNNYTFALNPDGTLNWWVDLHSNISASPVILDLDNDIVVIACMDGNVYGFYTTNGTSAGTLSIGAPVSSTPVYKDPYLYVADENGTIHAFNTSNNMINDWNFTTGGAIYSSPAIDARGNLFFGSADGKIYDISSSGSEVWNYTVGNAVNGSPAINDGMLYIGSADNNLYAIGDIIPPSVGIDSPSNGAIFNTANITVSWHGSDATSGIDHYEIRINSASWHDVGLNTSHTFTGLSDDSYTVEVKVIDNASNENTASVTFNVDSTAPEITINAPSDGAMLNTADVTVSWAGSDATSGIDHYEIRINSASWHDVGLNTSHTFTGLSDGSYTVEVKAVDNAGNENTASVTFTVDVTAPEVTIDSPLNGTIFNTTTVTVSWAGSDALSGIDHYEISMDSGNWIAVGLNTAYNFTGLSDGSHTVDVKAIDNATNEATDTVGFTVDTTNPTVSITSPADGTIFNTTTVTVSWTGSDATSGINHYEVRLDGGSWLNVGRDTSHDFTGLSDGSHTVEVEAVDNASNVNIDSVTFIVDATPPIVISHSPIGNNVSVDSAITVTFSEEMDQSTVSIEVNGVTGTISWNNNTATFTPSQNLSYDTDYTVNVTGSDLAGNLMDEYTWPFTTEKASATNETGTITGTVRDTNGHHVAGATVTLDTGETTTTDENGHFEIQASAGNHTLTISKDGYGEQIVTTSLGSGEVKEVQIPALAPSQENNTPSQENNGLLWLWIVLVLIVLAAIGVAVAKRKKPEQMSAESEETEESSSSTEETSAPEENTETEETAGEAVETEDSPSSTEDVVPPPPENNE